jgi:ZIP family zinc transporter
MLAPGVESSLGAAQGSRVAEAAFLGLVAASTLIVGAVLSVALPWRRRSIGLVAGFGAGALISALTLDLTVSAFAAAGVPAVVIGLGGGAIAFSAGNWALHRGGAVRHRKRSTGQQAGADPLGIVLGTVLDGIPESVVIGISLLASEGVGLAFLAAVAISNLPEAISATSGLRRTGWTTRRVIGLWGIVAVVSAVSAGAGFALLASAPPEVAATIQAFAAGAVLTMLADTMMPEAFEEAGPEVGLVTVLGYAIGALLTLVE